MEPITNFVITFFELFDWKVLLICAVGTSFIVGAINAYTPESVRNRYILPVVSFIVVILNTTFIPGAKFTDWQHILFGIFFNTAFAMLFYVAKGRWLVDKFIGFLTKQISDKLGKDE